MSATTKDEALKAISDYLSSLDSNKDGKYKGKDLNELKTKLTASGSAAEEYIITEQFFGDIRGDVAGPSKDRRGMSDELQAKLLPVVNSEVANPDASNIKALVAFKVMREMEVGNSTANYDPNSKEINAILQAPTADDAVKAGIAYVEAGNNVFDTTDNGNGNVSRKEEIEKLGKGEAAGGVEKSLGLDPAHIAVKAKDILEKDKVGNGGSHNDRTIDKDDVRAAVAFGTGSNGYSDSYTKKDVDSAVAFGSGTNTGWHAPGSGEVHSAVAFAGQEEHTPVLTTPYQTAPGSFSGSSNASEHALENMPSTSSTAAGEETLRNANAGFNNAGANAQAKAEKEYYDGLRKDAAAIVGVAGGGSTTAGVVQPNTSSAAAAEHALENKPSTSSTGAYEQHSDVIHANTSQARADHEDKEKLSKNPTYGGYNKKPESVQNIPPFTTSDKVVGRGPKTAI